MIRVGIVGAGRNTQIKHIPLLQAISGVEIISVCNRSRESSQKVAQQFNIPSIYDRWEDLIAADDTDAIVVGTWPYLHCSTVLAALKAGKHVMVEARMAMNSAEAREMLEAAQANPHLITQIVPSPFTLAVDSTIQRLIREDYLGNILAIDIKDHRGDFLDREAPLHWRQNVAFSGSNIMSLGIWYETLMRWVGEADQVMAKGKICVDQRVDQTTGEMKAVRIPDHLIVTADMRCGALAAFNISQIAGLDSEVSATLFGSKGTLRFTGNKLLGGRQGDSGLSEIPIPESEKGGWRVEEEFIKSIRGIETIKLTSFDTGLKYMIFTDAVSRSIKEGRAIPISEN